MDVWDEDHIRFRLGGEWKKTSLSYFGVDLRIYSKDEMYEPIWYDKSNADVALNTPLFGGGWIARIYKVYHVRVARALTPGVVPGPVNLEVLRSMEMIAHLPEREIQLRDRDGQIWDPEDPANGRLETTVQRIDSDVHYLRGQVQQSLGSDYSIVKEEDGDEDGDDDNESNSE
ncbi:hypothetical protein L1987_06260 [Smallanthus sonchifolius]|uniref:Uncharacterized protein n=1 Tax=Smallanthus sonchifolius TaxID=185202 RepID=A0ACB9JXM2_9ASTR|nr:hypothetical protein L1987_06260 [Smallanthus sonchifolius]